MFCLQPNLSVQLPSQEPGTEVRAKEKIKEGKRENNRCFFIQLPNSL